MRISDWSSDVCSADLGSGCSPISRRSQVAKTPVNVAASVKARLLKLAREEHQPFDVLLVRFALERLLYRLSISALRDQFILKGGLLVTLWLEDDNRVTRDADFLAFGAADRKSVASGRSVSVRVGPGGRG